MARLNFSSGMLGVTVVVVALAFALLGSWALSTEVSEVDVVTYNPVTDITPLFGSDKAPDYIEYNPSTNYTGYYTEDSIIGETKYFDGVDYDASSRPNQYRLNLEPISSTSDDDYDLSVYDSSASSSFSVRLFVANGLAFRIGTPYSMLLSDLTTSMGFENFDELTIRNTSSVDWTTDYGAGQWVTFIPKSWIGINPYSSTYADLRMPGNTDASTGSYADWTWNTPIMACKYDITNGTVVLYTDTDMLNQAGIFTPSEVYVAWGLEGMTYELATTTGVEAADYPDATYMDPSKGVELL